MSNYYLSGFQSSVATPEIVNNTRYLSADDATAALPLLRRVPPVPVTPADPAKEAALPPAHVGSCGDTRNDDTLGRLRR